jgi:hypothetical protein
VDHAVNEQLWLKRRVYLHLHCITSTEQHKHNSFIDNS